MKKNLKKYLALCTLILATILACQKEDQITSQDSSVTTETILKNENVDTERIAEVLREYKGREIEANFIGRVINEDNQPIMGATVSLGGQQKLTDANGIVVFTGAIVNENFAYAKASAFGYSNGSRVMVPNNQNSFTIKLFSLENSQMITSEGGEVTINSEEVGETIIRFSDGFFDENGDPYNGNVYVAANYLNPLAADTGNTMPGELYGINTDFEEVALGSYGMISVELRGDNGEKLQIMNPADIQIPIHPSQMGSAPQQVPMWSFNEDTGVWFEETVAYNTGSHFEATVTHFSFWNCDAPFPVVDFNLTVVESGTNTPLSGMNVTITYNNFSRFAVTDGNGLVSGKIPSNQTMTLTITDACGTIVYTNPSFGPFTGLTSVTIPVTLSTAPINVSGTVVDCNSAPVTNGYITYKNSGGQTLGVNFITSGTHSYTTSGCVAPLTVNMEGIDTNSGEVVVPTTVTANPNATANLIACGGTPTEYIRYSINNGPLQYEILNPEGGIQGIYMNATAASPNGGQTYLFGSAITAGTYPYNTNISNNQSFAFEALGDVDGIDVSATNTVPGNIQFTLLNNVGAVGTYINIEFTGNYQDQFGNIKNITGEIHIIRDY